MRRRTPSAQTRASRGRSTTPTTGTGAFPGPSLRRGGVQRRDGTVRGDRFNPSGLSRIRVAMKTRLSLSPDSKEQVVSPYRRLGPAHHPPAAPQDRRSFAAGITLAGIASGPAFGQAIFADDPFTLGVASGDPSPTGVVLWTRLAPDPFTIGGGMPPKPFEVRWDMATDETLQTSSRQDGRRSPTRPTPYTYRPTGWAPSQVLLPLQGWRLDQPRRTHTRRRLRATRWCALSFAFASCEDFPEGYFPGLRASPTKRISTSSFSSATTSTGMNTAIRTHLPHKRGPDAGRVPDPAWPVQDGRGLQGLTRRTRGS